MKIKKTFVLTTLGDSHIAVPVGKTAASFHGVIRLNQTGAEVFRCLQAGMDEAQTAKRLTELFDGTDAETALRDVREIVEQFLAAGIVEDEA